VVSSRMPPTRSSAAQPFWFITSTLQPKEQRPLTREVTSETTRKVLGLRVEISHVTAGYEAR
jgi:hypothetical protein